MYNYNFPNIWNEAKWNRNKNYLFQFTPDKSKYNHDTSLRILTDLLWERVQELKHETGQSVKSMF